MAPGTLSTSVETLVNGIHDSVTSHSVSGPPLLQNDPSKGWVVQKFGGTSVGKVPGVIASDIVKQWVGRNKVAVVCSARSSDTKNEGTTNRLLRAARDAENRHSKDYETIINTIRDDHIREAKAQITSPEIVSALSKEIESECGELIFFLAAAQRLGEISSRTLDTIVSKGENLSCRFMAALLRDRSVDAEFVDLAEAIDFKAPDDLDHSFYQKIAEILTRKIKECGNSVPVITGYFGVVRGGLLNRIGRGYTDLCAALVAVGLQAEELQIWKEVDGIFTANPSKVSTARLLSTITPAEAAELTFYGSEVIHPFTMEQAIRARVTIRIRNVMNLRNPGTMIFPDPISSSKASSRCSSPRFFRSRSSSLINPDLRPKRPTAVTVKTKILVMNIHSNKRSISHGFFAKIFSTLDKWRLSVDLISTSEVHVSMALHSESALVSGSGEEEKEIVDTSLKGAVEDLAQYGTVDLKDDMAIVSLVGKQMKNMPGIAGKMFSVLGEHDVNIEIISQGASEINISCVIEERDADRAINILHTNLFTFLD